MFGALVVGGFCERGDDGRLVQQRRGRGRSGVLAVYRKTHLWDRERLIFTPGDAVPPVLDTAFGRVGVLVCYDLEFPEMPRSLALRGAELLCVPVNWPVVERPPAGEHPPEQLTAMSAARVNRVFIAVCDRVGCGAGRRVGRRDRRDRRERVDRRDVGGGSQPRSPATRSSRACRTPSPTVARSSTARSRPAFRAAGRRCVCAVIGPVLGLALGACCRDTDSYGRGPSTPPSLVIRGRFAACGSAVQGGCPRKVRCGRGKRGHPHDRANSIARCCSRWARPIEIRARSPTVSVARTLTVSLHQVARASGPINGPPEPRDDPRTAPPSSVLAVRVPAAPRAHHRSHCRVTARH